MVNYIDRFQKVAEEVSSSGFIKLVHFKIYPPASDDVFQIIEKRTGVSLDNSVRDFYQQTNGMKLHWRIKPDITDEDLERLQDTYNDYFIDPGELDEPDVQDNDVPQYGGFANINLLPLEKVFQRDWQEIIPPQQEEDRIDFQSISYPYNEFIKHLKPFDIINVSRCMAFLFEERITNPKVIMLSDNYCSWDSTRITDFESYMEMLIGTRGIIDARKKVYHEYRGDLMPPLITGPEYWTEERIPKMFRKGLK